MPTRRRRRNNSVVGLLQPRPETLPYIDLFIARRGFRRCIVSEWRRRHFSLFVEIARIIPYAVLAVSILALWRCAVVPLCGRWCLQSEVFHDAFHNELSRRWRELSFGGRQYRAPLRSPRRNTSFSRMAVSLSLCTASFSMYRLVLQTRPRSRFTASFPFCRVVLERYRLVLELLCPWSIASAARRPWGSRGAECVHSFTLV